MTNLLLTTYLENLKKIFQNIKIKKPNKKYNEVVITTFFYKQFTDKHLVLLETFIKSHEIYNRNTLIYIFTNLEKSKLKYSERINIVKVPYFENKFMTFRVALNYNILNKFLHFNIIYIFDSDLIAIKNYENINDSEKNIGVTICNDWLKKNKFPINAGFLIINNKVKEHSLTFTQRYLEAYKKVLENKEIILKKSRINHEEFDLEEWWGDQYLFFYLFDKFPSNIKEIHKYEYLGLRYIFYNEDIYNHQSKELKNLSKEIDIIEIIKSYKKNIFFLHLTGNRKRFVKHIYEYFKKKLS